jgi:pentatricopeptide repeat protein
MRKKHGCRGHKKRRKQWIAVDRRIRDDSKRRSSPKLCKKGERLMREKRYAEAAEAFAKHLRNYPNDKVGVFFFIKSLCLSNNFERAKQVFDTFRRRNNNYNIYGVMIEAHSERQEIDAARDLFDEALSKGMFESAVFRTMACAYIKRGDMEEARKIIDMSLENNALDIKGCKTIINRLYSVKKFSELCEFIDSLPENLRDSPDMILEKANALRKLKRYGEARFMTASFLERDNIQEEDRIRARVILAFAIKDSGQPDKAQDLFYEIYKQTDPSSHHFTRILCGFVFAWRDNEYRGRINIEMARQLHVLLKAAEKNELNKNLRSDVKAAIGFLEHRFTGFRDDEGVPRQAPALS